MSNIDKQEEYQSLFKQVIVRIDNSKQKALRHANAELITLYWQIGKTIINAQDYQGWGSKVVDNLASDLKKHYPSSKGFSVRNLKNMRKFAISWPEVEFVQTCLHKLSWHHNCAIVDKISEEHERRWYVIKNIEHGWSRNVLVHQIESKLIERQGNAITNFAEALPSSKSELAEQSFKSPYLFDFLSLSEEALERDIEVALVKELTKCLLELGTGFAFVGKQFKLEVGGDDFYIDLLFYHIRLRCYVVIELKAGGFKPEHAGKLNFYLNTVDQQIKSDEDALSIGLLLCKSRNKIVAEYSLRNNTNPISIAEYQIGDTLPKEIADQLPSIEQLVDDISSHIKTEN